MSLLKSLFCLVLVSLALTGCNTADKKMENIADQAATAGTGTDATTSGYSNGAGLDGAEIKGLGTGIGADDGLFMEGSLMGSNADLMGGEFADPKHLLSTQIIYFLYDSSQVRPEFVKVIAAHSQYLLDHPKQRVILEGHADERGSPEYNIALSEQRAKSVSRTLQRQGVLKQQLDIVSYGEEKPSALEHDNAAWQLNRRVEIVYQAH